MAHAGSVLASPKLASSPISPLKSNVKSEVDSMQLDDLPTSDPVLQTLLEDVQDGNIFSLPEDPASTVMIDELDSGADNMWLDLGALNEHSPLADDDVSAAVPSVYSVNPSFASVSPMSHADASDTISGVSPNPPARNRGGQTGRAVSQSAAQAGPRKGTKRKSPSATAEPAQSRRAGQNSKKAASGSRSPSPSSTTNNSQLNSADLKKLKRLQKNRESAQLSRNRKKAYIEELERQVAALTAANVDLTSKVSEISQTNTQLQQENDTLRKTKGVDGFISTLSKPLSTGARKATAGLLLMSLFAMAVFLSGNEQDTLALPQAPGQNALPSSFNGRVLLDVSSKNQQARVLSYQPYADSEAETMDGRAKTTESTSQSISVRHPGPEADERNAAYLFCQRAFMTGNDGMSDPATTTTTTTPTTTSAASGDSTSHPRYPSGARPSINVNAAIPPASAPASKNPIITVVVPSGSVNSSVIERPVSKDIVNVVDDEEDDETMSGSRTSGTGSGDKEDWLAIRCQVLNVSTQTRTIPPVPAAAAAAGDASSPTQHVRRAAHVVDIEA